MYEPIWQAVGRRLSEERLRADVDEFFALSRWSSYDKILDLARLIVRKLEDAGAADARLIEFPADGRTFHGGWALPQAYDVVSARLIDADSGEALADYAENPTSLMMYSRPTPPNGVIAELVVADRPEDLVPKRVAGRFVLTSGIGVAYGLAAARAGAAGLVSDCRASARVTKDGPYLDTTNEWHNYTIPPWDEPAKGFGFAISPEAGRELRARVGAGDRVRLHAIVDTRHYAGIMPVISARLPGEGPDEIAITGHFDEFGADDNCSQVAVAVEVIRVLAAMIRDGEIAPLRRSVRILLPMEVRGLNALAQREEEIRHIRAGLNIDTVGTDQNAVTATCTLTESFAAAPSFAEELAAELLECVHRENPLFRWRRARADTIDNILGEPLIGAPTPAIYHFSGTHHVALDTPDRISGRMLVDMARVAATYAGLLASGGLKEAMWLAELSADHGERRLLDLATESLRGVDLGLLARLRAARDDFAARISSARWLAPDAEAFPLPEGPAAYTEALVGESRLYPREVYDERADHLVERLDRALVEAESRIRERAERFGQSLMDDGPDAESRCVPVKAFRGFAAFEDLDEAGRERLESDLGIRMNWGAPMWLQNALFFANGKRSTGEIVRLIRDHDGPLLEAAYVDRVYRFLVERSMVRCRLYVSREEVRAALDRAGIRCGDAVLGHFSLSRLGYVEGGADGLIGCLLDVLGSGGTLMMPTFTNSWVGHRPYDPKRAPSRTGLVTDRFWRRPGALRSAHPTHSFAAIGPLAEQLLAGNDHTQSPVSDEGPMGRLAEAEGKVLLFGAPESNTSMHVGEYIAGIPLPDFLCHVVEDGVRREVTVPSCPWHVAFGPAWERLRSRGLVTDVALGEGTITVLRCRDSIDAHAAVARDTPEALLITGCKCPACRRLRDHCRSLGRPM